jgi:NADH-quinone oxidoreductase subunit N
VWQAGIDAGLIWLVVASAVASAIGAYYYLRIVFYMYFGEDRGEPLNGGRSPVLWGFLMASAVVMVVGVVNLFGIEGPAQAAAMALVN